MSSVKEERGINQSRQAANAITRASIWSRVWAGGADWLCVSLVDKSQTVEGNVWEHACASVYSPDAFDKQMLGT